MGGFLIRIFCAYQMSLDRDNWSLYSEIRNNPDMVAASAAYLFALMDEAGLTPHQQARQAWSFLWEHKDEMVAFFKDLLNPPK